MSHREDCQNWEMPVTEAVAGILVEHRTSAE